MLRIESHFEGRRDAAFLKPAKPGRRDEWDLRACRAGLVCVKSLSIEMSNKIHDIKSILF